MSEDKPIVVILDLTDHTLHRASAFHLVTQCGLDMAHCQVGPLRALLERSAQSCTSCFSGGRGQLNLLDHPESEAS